MTGEIGEVRGDRVHICVVFYAVVLREGLGNNFLAQTELLISSPCNCLDLGLIKQPPFKVTDFQNESRKDPITRPSHELFVLLQLNQ